MIQFNILQVRHNMRLHKLVPLCTDVVLYAVSDLHPLTLAFEYNISIYIKKNT